jgi:hypothetical protein
MLSRTLAAAALLATALAASAQEEEKKLGDKDVKELQGIVEELRGLKFKKPVKVNVQGEKALLEMITKSLDEEMPPEKMAKLERVYKKLGLIPQDMNFRETLVGMLGDSVGGYYDPKTKQLYLIEREEGKESALHKLTRQLYGVDLDTMTTIHEMTHALQDQYYDLQSIPTDREGDDDVVKAMQCLYEGEANYVMYDWVMRKQGATLRSLPSLKLLLAGGAQGSEKMNKAPEVLKRGLTFPYMEGMVFVGTVLREAENWDEVEKMYGDLPLSTEQILHPEKFIERDFPQSMRLPDLADALGKGWEKLEENTLGELNVQIWLGEFMSRKKYRKTIEKASAGWDGDRYAVYAKGERTALACLSTWDTEDDAAEFAKQAKKALKKKLGEEGMEETEAGATWEGGSVLERRGLDVLWVETAGTRVDDVRELVWEETKREELKKVARKEKPNPIAENDVFALDLEPKAKGWRVEEDGTKATVTWKGLDGQATFRAVSRKGRDAEETLEEELDSIREDLEGARRVDWAPGAAEGPSASLKGENAELGKVRFAVVVLEAGKKRVVATLGCSEEDYEKALKVFEGVLKGYRAK